MKALLLSFALATSVAFADTAAPAPSLTPTFTPTLSVPPTTAPAAPDQPANPTNPGTTPLAGFPASRYESLWTKSPFAVATSDEATETSTDYSLVGVSNIGGVFYASLIEKQNQEHFLVSSDKPMRGLTLTSITRNHDSGDTFALVQKDGQSLTLKLEQPPAAAAGPEVATGQPNQPGIVPQQLQMPGVGSNMPNRPFGARFRRPMINLPPRPVPPSQQQPQQPQQPAPQATQVQPPPPPPQ